jgi:hypothetical protein
MVWAIFAPKFIFDMVQATVVHAVAIAIGAAVAGAGREKKERATNA